MRRRRLLGVSAAILSGTVAGCLGDEQSPSGPRTPPEAPREGALDDPDPGDDAVDDADGEATDAPGETDDTEPDDSEPTEPSGDLRVESVEFREDEEDMLLVSVVVENVADAERSGRLRVRAVAGEEESTVNQDISVDADDSEVYDVRPGLEYERFAADGLVDASVSTDE